MRKLIMLEIKKYKLFGYGKGVLIANLAIMAVLYAINYSDKRFDSYEVAFADMGKLLGATFTIFAAVLIARIIIDEYRNNTITLMFMYPIKRKKIMAAKLTIVAGFTFMTIFFSNLFIGSAYYLANSYFHFIQTGLTKAVLMESLTRMTLETIASTGMSLIPLYFGMRKKSVPATIVSAIILVSLTYSSNNSVTAFSFIAIPITLAAIGCLIAYLAIRNVNRVDVN